MNTLKEIRERHEFFYQEKEVRSWRYVGELAHKDRGELLKMVDIFAGHLDAAEIDLESVKKQRNELQAILDK